MDAALVEYVTKFVRDNPSIGKYVADIDVADGEHCVTRVKVTIAMTLPKKKKGK